MNELHPINQNILLDISDDNKEKKTASGIIIPETAQTNKILQKLLL